MRAFILIILLQAFIASIIYAQAEREFTVTESNSDNAAVIKVHGEDPDAVDYMNMEIGFNSSSHGWLRMRTNHHLNFFTNDQRRMTIRDNGVVSINNQLTVGSMVGDGQRNVAVSADGLLIRQVHPIQKMVYGPTSFNTNALVRQNIAYPPYLYCNSINAQNEYVIPEIPYTKYKITAIQFHLTDGVGSENFYFELKKYSQDYNGISVVSSRPNIATSGVEIEDIRIATLAEEVTIDQSLGEYARINIHFPSTDNQSIFKMRIYRVVLTYQQVD